MIRRLAWPAIFLFSCLLCAAQAIAPSDAELAAITARGRLLMEYDIAAWHATDAVSTLKPDAAAAPFYIAKKNGNAWEVVFGRLNPEHDKFFIVYRATQGTKPDQFTARKESPPVEDVGFYAAAARAIEVAVRDFGRQERNYNTYLLPSGNGQFYVYLLPAPNADADHPLGRDVRYTVTLDGGTIVDKRVMHPATVDPGSNAHTHATGNSPEDTDVFYVLTRAPAMQENVTTADNHVYVIAVDGKIKRAK